MEYYILINLKQKKATACVIAVALKLERSLIWNEPKQIKLKTQLGLIVATYVALLIITQLTNLVTVKNKKSNCISTQLLFFYKEISNGNQLIDVY